MAVMHDALLQHVKHVVLQTGIWTSSRQSIQTIPSPEGCEIMILAGV